MDKEAEEERKRKEEIEKAIKDGETEKEFEEEHKNANGDTSEVSIGEDDWAEIARKLKEKEDEDREMANWNA